MKSIVRYLRFFAGRIGIAGVCGFALLVFSACFLLASVQPLEEEVRMLSARAARLQSGRAAIAPAAADPAAEIEALLNDLPSIEKAPDFVAILHAQAREHQLVLESGEYHVIRDGEARLTRYQVRFPLKGDYVQIRSFVAAAMDRIPSMSLEEFSIRRNSIATREVEARVQFGLLFAERR